ncbi:MAG: MCE family protein, partial [Bdellovibrionales bacterium]|nr:MCE family protein [Bdellovibrionales bacterium]
MSLLNTPEFKVGALVVSVGSLIAFMSLKVSDGTNPFSGSDTYHFTVDDAGGLIKNSAVKMAGIKVGTISEIELKNGKAKIYIQMDDDVTLTQSGKVELRSDGILGDRHVEIVPGNPEDAPLESGSEIASTGGGGGLNEVMKEVGAISKQLKELSINLNNAMKGSGDDSSPVGRIVLNVEKLTKDLAEITDTNKEKINNILSRLDQLTKSI